MPELTDEEKRILELMKQLDAADKARAPSDAPARPLPERFTTPLFFDDEGKPFPVEGPLPSAEEQAAQNREVIKVLEEKLRGEEAPPADGPTRDENRRRWSRPPFAPAPRPGSGMEFEELVLRPASGAVDEAAVAAWLNALPHGFHDPVAGDGWYLSATPRTAAGNRQARLDHPTRFHLGVRVLVLADRIVVGARADHDDLARALELVTWLVSGGDWTVEIDCGPPEPVGNPRRLFPESLPDPLTLVEDATVSPVTDGTLLTWTDDTHPGREFVAHSGGTWRFASDAGGLRGEFTGTARAALNAAVAAVDSDDPELPEGDTPAPVTLEIEALDGIEYIHLDLRSPPASCRQVVALVSGWLSALENWQAGSSLDGLAHIREMH